MEITLPIPVQPQSQTTSPTSAQTPGSENATGAVVQKATAVQAAPKLDKKDISANPEQQKNNREEVVKKAAQMFKDFFPVSDVTFSIFKDSTGQYITRFTSLRDGKVTYIPEQNMLNYLHRSGKSFNNIEINA